MATSCDKEAVRQAYEAVRDDKSETNWAVFKYDGNKITVDSTGVNFDEFSACFKESERQFGYLRMFTGDELSKRAKFAFVTWIGSAVSGPKRARVSIDKSLVKEVISNFAVEISAEDAGDLDEEKIKELLIKAGGANYGTGGARK